MGVERILTKLVSYVPKAEGSQGTIKLAAKQLEQIAEKEPEVGKVIQELTKGAKNPTLEIGYKAQSNYSIAGMRLRDGKNTLASGAVSLNRAGTMNPTIKGRINVNGGETFCANGFIDTRWTANAKDIEASVSRRGGKFKFNTEAGNGLGKNAYGIHVSANNEEAVIESLENMGAKHVAREVERGTDKLQKHLNEMMGEARTFLQKGKAPAPVAEKIVEPLHVKPHGLMPKSGFPKVKELAKQEARPHGLMPRVTTNRVAESESEAIAKVEEKVSAYQKAHGYNPEGFQKISQQEWAVAEGQFRTPEFRALFGDLSSTQQKEWVETLRTELSKTYRPEDVERACKMYENAFNQAKKPTFTELKD